MRAGVQVANIGEDIELNPAHQRSEAIGRCETDHGKVARAGMGHQLARAVLDENIDHLVGDLGGDLIPGDALPLAFASLADPLQRIAQAVALIHRRGMNGALLAATRVCVGNIGVDLRILRQLLFAQHDAVLDIDIEGAVADAVDAVRCLADLVPGKLAAVEIFPVAIGIFFAQGVFDGLESVQGPRVVRGKYPGPYKR